jgi:hypothetical protein
MSLPHLVPAARDRSPEPDGAASIRRSGDRLNVAVARCVLCASGRRFSAKRYLATSTLLPELVADNRFEFVVSRAAPGDDETLLADLERFLTAPRLDLSRLFAFPGVERVAIVLRDAPHAGRPLVLPARICIALGKHGLELEVQPPG